MCGTSHEHLNSFQSYLTSQHWQQANRKCEGHRGARRPNYRRLYAMHPSDEEQLFKDLPRGEQAMFLSLRDAGVSGAPKATNVRWVHVADDGTLVVNIWRDDILDKPVRDRWVAEIWPRSWEVKTAARRSKRDALIEMLNAHAGNFVRVVILERKTRNARKHRGTRFDGERRWRVQRRGKIFRFFRARPGENTGSRRIGKPKDFGNLNPARREIVSQAIERDDRVKKRTLERARGRCENPPCRDYLHYVTMDVHHVISLGNRGADHTRNTVALCPACHARVHRGKPQIRKKLERAIKKVVGSRR